MSKHQSILNEVLSLTLYNARMRFNETQYAFSERCGISPRTYEDLELSYRLPTFRSFINIIIAAEIDANEMVRQIKERGYLVADEVYEYDEV